MFPITTQRQFARRRSKGVESSRRAIIKCASTVHVLVVVTKHLIPKQYDQFRNKPKKNLAASLEGTWCTLPLMAT